MTRNLSISLFWISAVAVCFPLRAELPSRPEFTQEKSDLKADPAIHFGKLPNGLHYAIRANHEPKARASLRLVVLAGSAQETDDQQGLAHFIEHMAFNGTTHYPPGTLVEYFQRLGMSFGGDTNAHTGFDETVYLLELPSTENKTTAEACQVLADYARGELQLPEEIERERGVILSEKRDRDSVEYRRSVALENFLLGETLVPKRMPIGLTDVISKAGPDRFRAYYDRWYRPERMAVVAVGDFDPAEIEKEIIEKLGSLSAATPGPQDPALGQIPQLKAEQVLYLHQPEAAETVVLDYHIRPYTKEEDTKATRLKHLPRNLAQAILDRRFSILARQADAPFLEGEIELSESLDFYHTAGFELVCKPDQWSTALAVGEKELHRALQYGFSAAELQEAVANYRHRLEEAVKTAPTRRSQALADHLYQSLIHKFVVTTPEDELALYQPALEKITVEDCLAALRAEFSDGGEYLAVVGNAKIEPTKNASETVSAEEQIRATARESALARVDPPAKTATESFAYTHFGAPGTVAERKHVDDLDLDLLKLSNGVRVNFKKTDFEANRIHISLHVGTGQLTEPHDQPGLDLLGTESLISGGLGKHSLDDIIHLAAGRTVGLGFQVASDTLILSGSTNRQDLLLQLQLLTAYLVDAGYRPEALVNARKGFEPMYQKFEHTPQGVLQLKVERELASGDPRFGVPPKTDLLARNFIELRAWLEPQFKKGPIEISLVGDLDPEATIAALNQTVGALPARESKPKLEKERRVVFPKPFEKEYTYSTEIPRGLVAIIWPTTDARDVQVQRRMRVLSDVFGDRLRLEIRQKLGDAYSPYATESAEETYPGYGKFVSFVEVDPAKTKSVNDAVLKISEDLVANGVTEDELSRAKQPVLTVLRESARTNTYWLRAVLQTAQENPQHLDWCRTRYADNEAITKADIDALAKKYLPSPHAFKIIVVPEKVDPPKS